MFRMSIGNSLDGVHPLNGSLREARFGGDDLSAEYGTFSPHELSGVSYDGKSVSADFLEPDVAGQGSVAKGWLSAYMSRGDGDSRMTGFADMFVPLVSAHAGRWYTRLAAKKYTQPGTYRSYGLSGATGGETSVSLRVTRISGSGTTWFDNASMLYSGILWEANCTGGGGRWYPLYVIPGSKPVRVNMPIPSDRVRLRAISCDGGEWLQRIRVNPVLDYSGPWLDSAIVTSDALVVDGVARWNAAPGMRGVAKYVVTQVSDPVPTRIETFGTSAPVSGSGRVSVRAVGTFEVDADPS